MSSPSLTPAAVLPEPARIDEPRFGLPHAFGVAVLLHLLLLLLVYTYPEVFTGDAKTGPPPARVTAPPGTGGGDADAQNL